MTRAKVFALSSMLGLSAAVGCSSDEPCDPNASGTICTIAGTGLQGYGGDNGPATEADLNVPQDSAVGPDGRLWVLDFNNYLIRAIDSEGVIRTVLGTGLLGDSPPAGQTEIAALDASFNHTTNLFFHDGYLYLAAWHNSRVKRVNLSTMMMENFAGAGRRTYYYGDNGPALGAALDLPSSIAVDPDNNIVIMDQANQVIRRVNQDGTIERIAGTCVVDYDFACDEGETPVACPEVTVGGATYLSNKSVCGDPATECAKPCTPGFYGDGGPALEMRIAQPFGQMADPAGRMTYDADGNLIFADSNNHRIRRIDTEGIVTTLAGTGNAGYSGDMGPAVDAELNNPVDVVAAPDGSIYFTDVYNSCVRRIDPDGTIYTAVGQCSEDPASRGFSGDGGAPTDATLDRPYGIELDGNRLYVADSYNQRVRVVNLE